MSASRKFIFQNNVSTLLYLHFDYAVCSLLQFEHYTSSSKSFFAVRIGTYFDNMPSFLPKCRLCEEVVLSKCGYSDMHFIPFL